MKYKKYNYILVLILMLVIGINKTYAEESKTCYYMSNDNNFKATLKLSWGYNRLIGLNLQTLDDYAKVSVDKIGDGIFEFNKEPLINWWDGGLNNWYSKCTDSGNVCFEPYHKNETEANKENNPSCPKYIVFQHSSQYYVWGTESESIAKKAVQDIRNSGHTGYYASFEKNGSTITSKEYYSEFVVEGIIDYNSVDDEPTCADYNTIFGDKNNPESISYIVNKLLTYVRIIVPILIILLGTIDFAKAVLAGKEDNMKKAQRDFIKRVAAGIIVFLVPTLVNIIMYLADIVWAGEYVHCNL